MTPHPLTWGRHYLVCPPGHFEVLYEINPWMHREVAVDRDRACAQWEAMVAALSAAGASVERIEPVAGLPDMVFTANLGLVDAARPAAASPGTFVVGRFRHPERQGESEHAARAFEARAYEIRELEDPASCLEGAGDALPFAGKLLAGYRIRSDFAAHTALARLLGVEVLSLELVDQRFYHLDLSFCPLGDRRAIVAPHAWDAYGRKVVEHLVPEPLVLEPEEALTFCANSVVVGTTIVMPACPPRVGRQLEAWGFDIVVCPVDEFLKAGGGVRCLTLALDVPLSGAAEG